MTQGLSEYEAGLIEEYFYMFDSNGDSKIGVKELPCVLKVVFKEAPNPEKIAQCMKRFDADGSGELEFDEFVKMYLALRKKPLERGSSIKEWFKRYDVNGDGHLGKSEVRAFLRDTNLNTQITEETVERLMAETDVDNDGRISYREFCLMFGRSMRENS